MVGKPNPPSIARAQAELRRRQELELEQRRRAVNILQPEALAPGKKSAVGVLMTTLGGEVRPIAARDLAAFRRNIAAVSGSLAPGVTAQELVNASREDDRERARQQIRHAAPTRLTDGAVTWVTDAGPDSKVRRHIVRTEFANYGAALALPATPKVAAEWLALNGRLRFECGCERFRYMYRYVCTVAGCVAGRKEHGFPKITNPDLAGLACKHALRVAQAIREPLARQALATMIASDRAKLDARRKSPPAVVTLGREQADALFARQGRRAAPIRTSEESQSRAVQSAIRRALAGQGRPSKEVQGVLAALKARRDIGADAIVGALRTLLQQQSGRAS